MFCPSYFSGVDIFCTNAHDIHRMIGAIIKCSQLILMKIIQIVATRCQIFGLKCSKLNFGWGFAGGAYSARSDPVAGFKGLLLRGK